MFKPNIFSRTIIAGALGALLLLSAAPLTAADDPFVVRTLTEHSRPVYSVAYSPDGTTVASSSANDTIKLWNAATGTLIRTLRGHSDWVRSVAYSSDGTTIASGSYDKTIKLWHTATGTLIRTLTGHSGLVWSVAYSPDDTTIASGSIDGVIKLWNAATGTLIRTLTGPTGHSGSVYSVAYSPDGSTIASGSSDKTIKLWNVVTGTLIRTMEGHIGNVRSVAYSPDGSTIASGSWDETIKLWNAATGRLIRTLKGHSNWVYSVTYSPDGSTIASGSKDNTIKLWNAATGTLIRTLAGNSGGVYSIAYSPDGASLVSGNSEIANAGADTTGSVTLYDAYAALYGESYLGRTHTALFQKLPSEQRKLFAELTPEQQTRLAKVPATQQAVYISYLDDITNSFAAHPNNTVVFQKNGSAPQQSNWRAQHAYRTTDAPSDPWERVGFYARQQLTDYLALADKPRPTSVDQPALPPAQTITQEQWETNEEFQERVDDATAAREAEIARLEDAYRLKVDAYNAEVQHLRALAAIRQEFIDEVKPIIIADAFVEVFRGWKLAKPNLDQQTGELFVESSATGNQYSAKILIQDAPAALRQQFYTAPNTIDWQLTYRVTPEGEIALVAFAHDGSTLTARAATNADLPTQTGGFTATIGAEDTIQALALQSPTLTVGSAQNTTVVYKDGSKDTVSYETYKDDLEPQITRLTKAPADKNLWLFVVGIENYTKFDPEVYDVSYAARSAELFAELMQKRYGILNKQTTVLINETATTTKITEELEELLAQVRPTDTIIFYYNGHGIPVPEKSYEPYMLPIDKNIKTIVKADDLQIKRIYTKLEQSNARQVVVLIDSCFSGRADGRRLNEGTAALSVPLKKVDTSAFTKTVILTAGTKNQYSNEYAQKGHRLFTYFVMKEILATKSDIIDIDTLYQSVSHQVHETSRNDEIKTIQNPQIEGATGIGNNRRSGVSF